MILYFSASGNTEYIAKLLAKELDDECIDMNERIRTDDYTRVFSKKPFVICTPVYVCDIPIFVREYIKRLPFRGNRKVYYVFTSGGYAGMSGTTAKKLTVRKNMIYMGHAELTMPSNHIVSNAYPSTEPDECRRRISDSSGRISGIAYAIKHGEKLTARHVYLFEKLVILPFNPIWVRYMQPSKDFRTTDKCVGCGKCSRVCPINNIQMIEKRPVWGERCAHCMACILGCPFEAIEYADITPCKDKYNIRKYVSLKDI